MKVTVERCESSDDGGGVGGGLLPIPIIILDTENDDIKTSTSSENLSTDGDNSDLEELKKVTARLRLDTRRPSIMEWKALQMNRPLFSRTTSCSSSTEDGENNNNNNNNNNDDKVDGDEKPEPGEPNEETKIEKDETWTRERVDGINEALQWIRQELQEMRRTDQKLARQLITARTELHRLKLAKSCNEHAALLEDVALSMDERDEMSELCDMPLPLPLAFEPCLKELGVTRMHFSSARRFSLC